MNEMKDLAIYGAGGFGRELACLIKIINTKKMTWNFIGFFDDGIQHGESNEYGRIIGGMQELNRWDKPLCVTFAIGSSEILSKLTSSITNTLLNFPNIISPGMNFLDENNVKLGKGNVFCSGCIISCNVTIGNFNLFISTSAVGHDVTIGNCNVFMPSTKVSGKVIIGDKNTFGVSSTILPNVTIGHRTIIGANSLIIQKTKDGMTYIGSPAVQLRY